MVTNGHHGQAGLKPRWKVSGVIAVLVVALASILFSGTFATLTENRRPAVRRPAVRLSANPSIPVSPLLIQSRDNPDKGMFLIASPKLQDPNFIEALCFSLTTGRTAPWD